MATVRGKDSVSSPRLIAFAGVVAAAYVVATLGLAPLAYGPLQLRVGSLLKPLALVSPVMAWTFAVGVALANLSSPFGFWDIVAMPLVTFIAARLAWRLRRWAWAALFVQAFIIAVGVAVFPLHLGGGLPVWPTAAWVFASEFVLYALGYVLLRATPLWDEVRA